jgi:hypothetical protein
MESGLTTVGEDEDGHQNPCEIGSLSDRPGHCMDTNQTKGSPGFPRRKLILVAGLASADPRTVRKILQGNFTGQPAVRARVMAVLDQLGLSAVAPAEVSK